jgi:hypothetical protein
VTRTAVHNAPSRPRNYKYVLQNLIWPAAAGNVIWTIAQLVVTPGASGQYLDRLTLARLALLAALAYYLFSEWLPLRRVRRSLDGVYCLGDCLLVATGVLVAVAVQSPPIVEAGGLRDTALPTLLGTLYAVALVWHAAGWWEPDMVPPERIFKVGINVFGLFGVLIIRFALQPSVAQTELARTEWTMWPHAAVMWLVIGAWQIAQRRWPIRTEKFC